jgi:hypothetical protein
VYIYTPLAVSTAAVANRFVASANMQNAAYTVANASPAFAGAVLVTVGHTTVAGADTLGVITVVGTDINGQVITDVITPVAGGTATGVKYFRTITSVTGSGWTAVSTADTIVVGHAAGSTVLVGTGILRAIVVNATAAATIVVSDNRGTLATLKASIAEGTYYYDAEVTNLKIALTSTNDITVIHTPSLPSLYAP